MAGTEFRAEARAVWERGVRSDIAMQAEIEAALAAAEERGRLWKEKQMETLRGAVALANQEISRLVAAASDSEERGRRRGVEERDELLRKLLAWADSPPVKAVTVSAWIHGVKFKPEDVAVWDEVRAALAPRVPHASEGPPCAGCGHPKWQHQYGSKEQAFCCTPLDELQRDYCRCKNYLAPRGSAPVAHVCICKGDSTAQFWDGGHLPNCPVVAPRDSGKES